LCLPAFRRRLVRGRRLFSLRSTAIIDYTLVVGETLTLTGTAILPLIRFDGATVGTRIASAITFTWATSNAAVATISGAVS
jgi:hypothetical protein